MPLGSQFGKTVSKLFGLGVRQFGQRILGRQSSKILSITFKVLLRSSGRRIIAMLDRVDILLMY